MALAAIFYFGQFFVYRRFSHYEQFYQIKVLQMSDKVSKILAKSLKVPVKEFIFNRKRHWKEEFHIFFKELKLLNHDFLILAANERAFNHSYKFDFAKFLLVLKSIFYR